jgi:hypothetical protein
MVLSNSAKRARYANTISVQNQGGGDKKAGFPYQVGRQTWTNVYFGNSNLSTANAAALGKRRCCTRTDMTKLPYTWKVSPSRPIGRVANNDYWHIPGTK